MISQEHSEAVARALNQTFGVTRFDDIRRVSRGPNSNLAYRIVVQGSAFLLRINTRKGDPKRQYLCMHAAAEAGLAPRVWYSRAEDRISITDFVQAAPFPVKEALGRLPTLLRELHALPAFDRAPYNTTCTFLVDKGPALDGFLRKFQTANVLPEAQMAEFLARHAELAAVYRCDAAEMVSSHNDLFKPDNILFDGKRVWLVDWEAAFLNDRYADLAVVANQVVTNEEEEMAYLQEYFGSRPNPYQRARFYLMQQLSHLFYTMAFLYMGSDKAIDWSAAVPELGDYHRGIWAGEIDLADKDVRIVYSRVHWQRFLQNVQQARYQEALKIVSGRHASVV